MAAVFLKILKMDFLEKPTFKFFNLNASYNFLGFALYVDLVLRLIKNNQVSLILTSSQWLPILMNTIESSVGGSVFCFPNPKF